MESSGKMTSTIVLSGKWQLYPEKKYKGKVVSLKEGWYRNPIDGHSLASVKPLEELKVPATELVRTWWNLY